MFLNQVIVSQGLIYAFPFRKWKFEPESFFVIYTASKHIRLLYSSTQTHQTTVQYANTSDDCTVRKHIRLLYSTQTHQTTVQYANTSDYCTVRKHIRLLYSTQHIRLLYSTQTHQTTVQYANTSDYCTVRKHITIKLWNWALQTLKLGALNKCTAYRAAIPHSPLRKRTLNVS